VYRYGDTLAPVPAKQPRVQVTVDPELAEALTEVDPKPPSRSRLMRDLALRGARALSEERRRSDEAHQYLLRVADGEVDLDFDAARDLHQARGEHLR